MKCWKSAQSFICKVVLLDHQEFSNSFEENTLGEDVLKLVFDKLGLIETIYFGLRYIDPSNQTHWLDPQKKIQYQIKGKRDYTFYFGVKFYAVDPCGLREEVTRYQFFLQVKQDILQGRLPISFDLAAELGAYVVQSELGDYDSRRHTPGYVSEFRFVSNQSAEMEGKITQLHRGMTGKKPALAELCYLDKVKNLEMYGVDLHPVLGEDNTEYFLGLTPTGVIVLRNKNKVASYSWAKIVRMYRKGKYFMIQVSDSKASTASTLGFETPSKEACKHLHKCCFEQCDFFKNYQSPVDYKSSINDINRLRSSEQFVRVPSKRYQRRLTSSTHDLDSKTQRPTDIEIPQEKSNHPASEKKSQSNHWDRSESPKSIQSLPPLRGLYSSNNRISSSRRSVSVESRSSNDSKSVRCMKHGSRKGSDSESEVSKYSTKSRRRRNRSKRSSSSQRNKHRYILVDSKEQWKEVQRKQSHPDTMVQRAKVVSPRSHISDGDESHLHTKSRRHRKHRSTSRSSGEGKSYLPEELKRHLDFNLIDTEGMSETQLREIPYKVVETSVAKAVKVKLSSAGGRSHHNQSKSKSLAN